MDPAALMIEVARDALEGASPEMMAGRFHNTVAGLIAESLKRLGRRTGITTVGLTGGCFQNRLLTERTVSLLPEEEFTVLLHQRVPPNDGGIALGQGVSARARARKYRNG